jgi:hypothetical protein
MAACVLVFCLTVRPAAQSGDPASKAAVGQAQALRIVVLKGEHGVNVVRQKTAVAPIVEVRDRNDQPIAGAVVFRARRRFR